MLLRLLFVYWHRRQSSFKPALVVFHFCVYITRLPISFIGHYSALRWIFLRVYKFNCSYILHTSPYKALILLFHLLIFSKITLIIRRPVIDCRIFGNLLIICKKTYVEFVLQLLTLMIDSNINQLYI